MEQIREMLSVAEVVVSTNQKDAQAHYAKMEPLWTRPQAEREEDIKVTRRPRKRKEDMKAFNEMIWGREAERKADKEKRMAKGKAEH